MRVVVRAGTVGIWRRIVDPQVSQVRFMKYAESSPNLLVFLFLSRNFFSIFQ